MNEPTTREEIIRALHHYTAVADTFRNVNAFDDEEREMARSARREIRRLREKLRQLDKPQEGQDQ